MPFSIVQSRIIERCGLNGASSPIEQRANQIGNDLAAALGPLIEPEIFENPNYTMTLSVALWNLAAADFLGCLRREPGATEGIRLGELQIEPSEDTSDSLRAEGWRLLEPFLLPRFSHLATRVLEGRDSPIDE
jgi:hypothetical protein